MSDNLNDLLFAFIQHMKARNYAKATLTGYSRCLRQFIEYLRDNDITDAKRVTRDTLAFYQATLMELKAAGTNTIATVSIKIRAIKRFFEYMESSNHILINPAEHIKEPKKETRLPRAVLTEEEARKVLEAPNLSTLTGIRDRTIMEVFYGTGIRLEELVKLTIFDCDLQGGLLRVNKGKFMKDRVVPLGRHAVRFLKEYITRIRPLHTKNNKAIRSLFVSQSGHPITWQVIGKMVSRYGRQAKIQKRVTPHIFRHTFATQLVKNGADITAVRKMLGHSHLSVTQIYTRVAAIDVKKTHRQSHPREKDKTDRDVKPEVQGYFNVSDET
ncbi:MAG TPA: site-specific tyrosine recombinase XerD [Nitrospiraceae bacterium]|jgi:integrase/recombinase XerD|nr:site-specific tyrosine recombinase XerD [Nitrospiraceae bacterium]